MPNVKLYDMKAKEVGTLELSDALFNAEYNEAVIHQKHIKISVPFPGILSIETSAL